MLKRKYFFTYKGFPIPPLFIVEGFQCFRFATKDEVKKTIRYLFKKMFDKLTKTNTNIASTSIRFSGLSSFDNQINEKGAIVDQEGGLHTTASSYKNYLKDNDLVIKDWSEGSLKKQGQQFSNRDDIARTLERLTN